MFACVYNSQFQVLIYFDFTRLRVLCERIFSSSEARDLLEQYFYSPGAMINVSVINIISCQLLRKAASHASITLTRAFQYIFPYRPMEICRIVIFAIAYLVEKKDEQTIFSFISVSLSEGEGSNFQAASIEFEVHWLWV